MSTQPITGLSLTSHFGNLRLRPTEAIDIPFVITAEQDPVNVPFIKQWTCEEHLSALDDPNIGHWIVEATSDNFQLGYLIANGLCNSNGKIYLKRVVITRKDQGHGRQALRAFHQMMFNRLGFDFIWLCVYPHNMRARHLYSSEGYIEIGLSPQEKHIMMSLKKQQGHA